MSSWIEGVHTINLLQDVNLNIYDRTVMILTTKDKFDYYIDSFRNHNVFRYLCLDRNNEHVLKNCFITKIIEYEKDISIMFYYGYKVSGDELFDVKRGIKLNKIRMKMKKST